MQTLCRTTTPFEDAFHDMQSAEAHVRRYGVGTLLDYLDTAARGQNIPLDWRRTVDLRRGHDKMSTEIVSSDHLFEVTLYGRGHRNPSGPAIRVYNIDTEVDCFVVLPVAEEGSLSNRVLGFFKQRD